MKQDISRRSFLYGALSLGATAAAGAALAGCTSKTSASAALASNRSWDLEADAVVVGMGFAGLAAAYEAAKAGCSVALLEKAPEGEHGGNSRVCAQAVWAPQDQQASTAYFKELTSDYHLIGIDDEIIEAYIAGAGEHEDWLLDEFGAPMIRGSSIEYPLAQAAGALQSDNLLIHKDGLAKSLLWQQVWDVVSANPKIDLKFETAFTDLIFNEAGEVIGIEARSDGQIISIKASKGVILCCGGFEFDQELKANYSRYPALAWGTPYNTGDGIKACMKHDIAFWHMNSATPATKMGIPADFLGEKWKGCSLDFGVSSDFGWIWLDKHGSRFMDETRDYQHGYGRNAIFYNDSMKMEWPRLPLWQIQDGGNIKRTGMPAPGVCGWLNIVGEVGTAEALEQLMAQGLLIKAETIEELAAKMGVDTQVVQGEIESFNNNAASGSDDSFGRSATKMRALEAPYYAAQIYPVMVNTNGGPKRNAEASILRNDGTPIPRLYSSGEFGSLWAWYYQGAGNISECMVFGRIAGRNVAQLSSWDFGA